jgi:hypothetical protein
MKREESEREEVNPMEVIKVVKRLNQARGTYFNPYKDFRKR